jgi:hypothetical protein
MDAFKHGLAAIQKRREESITTEYEEGVRQQLLDGLMIGLNVSERSRKCPVESYTVSFAERIKQPPMDVEPSRMSFALCLLTFFTTRRASKHPITLAALLWPTLQCSVDPFHNSRPEW